MNLKINYIKLKIYYGKHKNKIILYKKSLNNLKLKQNIYNNKQYIYI